MTGAGIDASPMIWSDRPHHASIHPGGIVITARPLTDTVPVEMAAKGFLITQYTHEDIEAVGLPKIDLLGIRALTVLSDTTDLVRSSPRAGLSSRCNSR